jgi:hypothetical protein
MNDPLTPRQQSIVESVANREVGYGTHFGGFYYNRVLQFELAAKDQEFLRALYQAGEIWHKAIDPFDFEVRLREEGSETTMATYEVGEEIQFTRQLKVGNPERVINEDEKGLIVAVAADGTYSVKLPAGDGPFAGITDDDIEPSIEPSGDEITISPVAKPAPPPAPVDDADDASDASDS